MARRLATLALSRRISVDIGVEEIQRNRSNCSYFVPVWHGHYVMLRFAVRAGGHLPFAVAYDAVTGACAVVGGKRWQQNDTDDVHVQMTGTQ